MHKYDQKSNYCNSNPRSQMYSDHFLVPRQNLNMSLACHQIIKIRTEHWEDIILILFDSRIE